MLLLADIPGNVALFIVVMLVVIFVFVLIGKVIDGRRSVKETAEREQTRREVAAYVAEGSMTADDARKILGESDDAITKARKKIAESIAEDVEDGVLEPEEAQKALRALDANVQPVKA